MNYIIYTNSGPIWLNWFNKRSLIISFHLLINMVDIHYKVCLSETQPISHKHNLTYHVVVSFVVGSVTFYGLQFLALHGPVTQHVCPLSQSESSWHVDGTNALMQKSRSQGISSGELKQDIKFLISLIQHTKIDGICNY